MNRYLKSILRSIMPAAFALGALSLPSTLEAGENDDFRFAGRLYRDGMFIAAAEEYIRFSEKYPSSQLRPAALFHGGESWMKAGRPPEAMEAFAALLASYPSDENACRARFYRGDILRVLKRYREAADELLMIEESYPDCPLTGQAQLTAGECLISSGDHHGAAAILRRLKGDPENPDLQPRAMYSLAVALREIDRDLEADRILEDLISGHSGSPVSALALLRLGERYADAGDLERAERYFRRAAGSYREKSLKERAVSKIIETAFDRGRYETVLGDSREYLEEFPESERRPEIYRMAIEAASKTGTHDRALEMIDMWRSEGSLADSLGEISLMRAGILAERRDDGEALEELERFRHTWPASPLLGDALLLEANLLRRAGAYGEAAARLLLALLEKGEGPVRAEILSTLASLSLEQASDTLAAIRYWEMIVSEGHEGSVEERALWEAGRAKEALGDIRGASEKYSELVERYPDGTHSEAASAWLSRRSLSRRDGTPAIRKLAGYAMTDDPPAARALETGIILLEDADMPEEASAHMERAIELGLGREDVGKAKYYLGSSYNRMYELSAASRKPDDGLRKKAISTWLEVARESSGNGWGRAAHRKYLEYKLEGWKLADQLARLDEFIRIYGDTEDRWWALGKKVEFLYIEAGKGQQWAIDSALVFCGEILRAKTPEETARESLLRSGYLYRLKDDMERASESFERFVREYPEDGRTASVWYDLGETLVRIKEYGRAVDAFSSCLDSDPSLHLEERCYLRIGDCRYYMHDFENAADIYRTFGELYAESDLADESSYREALALERLGRFERCDSILTSMTGREGIARNLRTRLLVRLGQRLKVSGRPEEAKPLLAELVSLEKRPDNLALYAEVLFETGAYGEAAGIYSEAAGMNGVDSCRVFSGRAKARFRQSDERRGASDLEVLLRNDPGCSEIADVLLEKGKAEARAERCDEASTTLSALRERYSGTEAGSRALYHMALCDIKRGGYAEAIDKLRLFLRESPQTPLIDQAYFKLASAHYASGNLNLAASNYGLASEASGDGELSFLALKNMAMVYQELEEWEKAADGWYRIAESYPGREDIVEIFFNLGFCYSQSGNFEMAREVYSRIPGVAETEEQRGRSHYWTGISLKNLGRYDEAVREFLRVPYLNTGGMWGVTSKLEAALCYERLGQIEQAVQIYERIVTAHGESSDWGSIARKALDRINQGRDTKQQDRGAGGPGQKDG